MNSFSLPPKHGTVIKNFSRFKTQKLAIFGKVEQGITSPGYPAGPSWCSQLSFIKFSGIRIALYAFLSEKKKETGLRNPLRAREILAYERTHCSGVRRQKTCTVDAHSGAPLVEVSEAMLGRGHR